MSFGGGGEQVVTPIADGVARQSEYQMIPFRSSGQGQQDSYAGRGGVKFGLLNGAVTNWGFGGPAGGMVAYKNAGCYNLSAGALFSEIRIPMVCERPVAVRRWRDALYVIEFVAAWPTNTAGVENGIVLAFNDNLLQVRPVSAANPGFAVYNNGGVLTFAMRGAVGLQQTVIPIAGAITDWHTIRIELRSAIRDADGSIRVFVDDASAPDVTKTTADANFPLPGANVNSVINWGMGVASATEFLNYCRLGLWRGPDTALGM